jgi:hypothetical protein
MHTLCFSNLFDEAETMQVYPVKNQVWDEVQRKPKGLIFLYRLFCCVAVRIMWVNTANFINSPFTIHE